MNFFITLILFFALIYFLIQYFFDDDDKNYLESKEGECPPCNGDCNQGRDCPERNKWKKM